MPSMTTEFISRSLTTFSPAFFSCTESNHFAPANPTCTRPIRAGWGCVGRWSGQAHIASRTNVSSDKVPKCRVEQEAGKQDQAGVAIGLEQSQAIVGIGNIKAYDLPAEMGGKG